MALYRGISTDVGGIKRTLPQDDISISKSLYPTITMPFDVVGYPYAADIILQNKEEQGSRSFNRNTLTLNSREGLEGYSPIDVFSNTVHFTYQDSIIDGESFDLGIITQETVLSIGMWNGWKDATTITQLDVTSGQGVYVDGLFVGSQFQGLQELPLNIVVLGIGSAVVDVTISIRLGMSLDVYTIQVKGTRVVVPYLLDAEWGEETTITKRYLTSVFTSRNMSETRVSQRSNPVRSISASLFFGTRNGALQAWSAIMASATTNFLMPYTPDQSELTQDQEGNTIYIDTVNKRFHAGSYLIVVHRDSDGTVISQDAVKIFEVYPDRIESEFDTSSVYSKGDDAYPGVFCLPALDGSGISPATGGVGLLTLAATEIYGNTMLPIDNQDYSPIERGGLPVYPFKVNWSGAIKQTAHRGGYVKASGVGQAYNTLGTRPYTKTTATTFLYNREKSWEASGFFSHVKGRAKPFFLQGPIETLTQAVLYGGGGAQVELRLDPIITVNRMLDIQYIWLEDASGDIDIVKVDSVVELEDRSSIFTEATTIVPVIAWHALAVRLDSDEISETFTTDTLSEITLTFRELAEYE